MQGSRSKSFESFSDGEFPLSRRERGPGGEEQKPGRALGSDKLTARVQQRKSPTAAVAAELHLHSVGTAGFDRECRERSERRRHTRRHNKAPAEAGAEIGTAGFEPATP